MTAPGGTATGGLTIKGDLTAREDVTIEGSFEGSIDVNGHHLMTTAGSHVHAAVSARVVTVLGRLQGHVTAELVDIGPTALVDANVVAKQIALDEGARFNGAINTERARAAGNIARHRIAHPPSKQR